jgi:NitT/TauT family transport system ATP-binding protein
MSVLFITHSIAEAVFLSDQVVIMTPQPGSIDRVIDVELPTPRTLATRDTAEFASYVHDIQQTFVARGVLRER